MRARTDAAAANPEPAAPARAAGSPDSPADPAPAEPPAEPAPPAPPPGFAEDVRRGLTSSPKWLTPKYFYDDLGSRLFEAICALPEYYPTRTEAAILARHGGAIVDRLPGPLRLVELGSGDSAKSRLIIEPLLARQPQGVRYVPVDISASALERSAAELRREYPGLTVDPREGDYLQGLDVLAGVTAADGARTLVLFLGSTLGNLAPAAALELVAGVRAGLAPGDALLLGLDLKKSAEILIPAYDDSIGLTAAFNLNLLGRINRELGGRFDPRSFSHRAVWNDEHGRIEMHLVSRRAQRVLIDALGLEVRFEEGESILSECSYKFDRAQVERLAAEAGFEVGGSWTDERELFASFLLVAR